MEENGDQSFTDLVYGTPSPEVNRKLKLKKGASNLTRNHLIHQLSSSSSSLGSRDFSTYSIDSSSPEKSPSFSPTDRVVTNGQTLPLPSDSNFARERAKAIKQKKFKDQTSPFKLPKHAKSDFVKSSDLLTSVEYSHHGMNNSSSGAHKRKIDSVNERPGTSNESPVFNRKIRKAATYGWPSSSDSSDEESGRNHFRFRNKRVKQNTEASPDSTSSSNNPTVKRHGKHHQHVNRCRNKEEIQERANNVAGLGIRERIGINSKLKSSNSSSIPVPSTNSSMISPIMYHNSPRKVNPPSPVFNGKSSPFNMKPISSVLNEKSPLKVNKDLSNLTCKSANHTNLLFCTPKVSKRKHSSCHRHRKKGTSDQTRSRGEASASGLQPAERSASPCVIDLTSTPDSAHYVKQVKQMEEDELMARKLQEELDKEFAHTLAQQQDAMNMAGVAGSRDERHPEYWSTPDTYRVPYTIPPAPRYGEADSTEILQMLADMDPEREPVGRPTGSRRRTRAAASRPTDEDVSQGILHMLQHLQPQLDVRRWNIIAPSAGRRGRGRHVIATPDRAGNDYEDLLQLGEMLGDAREKGLSKGEMSRLPIISYKKTENSESEVECNICMCNYEDGDSQKMLPCFHSYHAKCIDKWIAKNATCPVCRVEIKL